MTRSKPCTRTPASGRGLAGDRRVALALAAALIVGLVGSADAQTTTALADQPPLSTYNIPGNLALVLSVEYPTAVSVAYTTRTYAAATQYQGYFDPDKCYVYTYSSTDTPSAPNTTAPASYFSPNGAASSHLCNVGSASGQWSGNFLNWASMQTIDTFRSVLTGGYRVIDTASTTVIEKAWASGQGGTGNFPDSTLAAADVPGATPFGGSGTTSMSVRIQGLGNLMRFAVGTGPTYSVLYYNSTDQTGAAIGPDQVTDFSAIRDNASPRSGVNTYNYSAVYTTTIVAPTTGTYSLRLLADDAASLYMGSSTTALISTTYNNSLNPSLASNNTTVSLTAGQSYTFKLTFTQFGGGAYLNPQWMPPGSSQFAPLGASPSASLYATSSNFTSAGAMVSNTAYDVFVRAKVCDSTSNFDATESVLCTVYGSNAKPEGLLQKYNRKLRYSAFGYLNDSSILRDGGVLRAQQKFVGPQTISYGVPDATNPAAEWNATTGVFVRSPDTSDATASSVLDSGVLNYINKFGLFSHSYKTYDPVSELYYAAIRYFKAVGNVAAWSNYDTTTQSAMADGFPVITNWTDPIGQNWCQKNFILGIGDTNTHADKNVTGNTPIAQEPTKPPEVIADTNSLRSPTDAVTATNRVGLMEGNYQTANSLTFTPTPTSGMGTVNPWGPCCNNNSALMAGLAYDSHTTDIRNDITNKPPGAKTTIDTYWVDVQEGQRYQTNNQYYLATKYGGFKVPSGFNPYTATTLPSDSTWWGGTRTDAVSGQKLPNNYFSGGDPSSMRTGLTTAFSNIVSAAGAVNSTSFLTVLPQITASGTASFAAQYDAATWTGDVTGSTLVVNTSTGTDTSTAGGDFQSNLDAQGTARNIATWLPSTPPSTGRGVQFQATVGTTSGASALSTAQLAALDTSYVSGDDRVAYLAYLRGDRTEEQASTTAGVPHVYRTRAHLLGDIVDSKPTVVGPPSFPFADASNPGYSTFKTGAASSRPTVVYVGANDGMLHAIDARLATSSTPSSGQELFAYVPNALFQGPNGTPSVDGLASLGNPSFVHHYMVNATASNFDVDFARTSDGSNAPPTSWTPDWHTILIGGLGKGGKAFYALDITDPASMSASGAGGEITLASKVLWEFTNANMGYSYGEPAVTKTKKYGWVAILPSGYNTADGRGHLFILNPRTGALLETIDMPTGSGGLAHVTGFVVDVTDDTVDALYAGDLQGNLWRVDVTAAWTSAGAFYPAPQRLAQLTDGSASPAGQPITTRPTIAVDPSTGNSNSGSRYVMVGTGRLLDSTDIGTTASPGQTQSFYAIIDGTNAAFNATAATGVTFPITRAQLANATSTYGSATVSATVAANPAGWYIDLASAQSGPVVRSLIDATVDVGRVGFAATQPVGTACAPGGVSQLYALNFRTGQTALQNSTSSTGSSGAITTTATLIPFQSESFIVSEFRFLSVNGVATPVYGGNGGTGQLQPTPNPAVPVKRLNWREVPTVD